ncbi:MAG: ATP-binding protein [Spongiibacteraceae bacterium]|jgi:two-component system sensor histidine kinase BaeS|nr:ATP-binding protein [Spongiibacteraceae bacterium]
MRIQHKLFLAMLGTSFVLVTLVVFMVLWSVDRGMLEYVNQRQEQRARMVANELGQFYAAQRSWFLLRQQPRLLYHIVVRSLGDIEPPPNTLLGPRRTVLPDLLLLDHRQMVVAGQLRAEHTMRIPIVVGEQAVGWLLVPEVKAIRSGIEEKFLLRQRQTLLLIAGITIAITALLAFLLARHLQRPIRALADGTHRLTQGDYRLPSEGSELATAIRRQDELGELARDFSQLAHTLAATDTSRKRWLADISHELRTPLAILRGEIEAMLDGVRPLTHENLQSAQQEVQHLNRLVDDLHALTMADIGGLQYRKQDIDVVDLWREVCGAHEARFQGAGLQLVTEWPTLPVFIHGDEDRLRQLLDNLLDNSLKYTQPAGTVRVALQQQTGWIDLIVEDSAPGVPPEALPRLFDHLYRVEHSRNRGTGGSGLGLAICQRIVAGHQGTITVDHSPLGGLRMHVRLPLH